MSQGTLASFKVYSDSLDQVCLDIESCSNSVLELIMHADELAKDLSHVTMLHSRM